MVRRETVLQRIDGACEEGMESVRYAARSEKRTAAIEARAASLPTRRPAACTHTRLAANCKVCTEPTSSFPFLHVVRGGAGPGAHEGLGPAAAAACGEEENGAEEERRDAKEHSQYPPNEFLYVNVVPSSFVTVLPSPPVVITLWGFPEPLPLPLEPEFPDEPELPEPDEDAALPEVEEELCWFGLTTTK